MKHLLALIFTVAFHANVCLAQNYSTTQARDFEFCQNDMTTPPEVKVETIYSNPQKRKASIVKDDISSSGVRYVWGENKLSYVGMNILCH